MGPAARSCLICQGSPRHDDPSDDAAPGLARCLGGLGFSPRVLREGMGPAAGDDRPRGGGGPGAGGEFHRLFLAAVRDVPPAFVVLMGGEGLAGEIVRTCRERGIATVLVLHGPIDRMVAPPVEADAVVVHSRVSADYVLEVFGLRAEVLPIPVDGERVRVESREPRYLTFLDPTPERGVYPFARIADELGRRRPDIPILVVERSGTEATLAGCGLDLTARGNVSLMASTTDPRKYWRVTRLLLAPGLGWEDQPEDVVGALLNGIPVIGSDRGGLPETLGAGGMILPLPDRLTPATRSLPTPEDVAPWVEAVIRLWDDEALRGEYERTARTESRRWSAEVAGPAYARSFESVRPVARIPPVISPGRSKSVILVPHHGAIEGACEAGLRGLEAEGVEVRRRGGCSAIDFRMGRPTVQCTGGLALQVDPFWGQQADADVSENQHRMRSRQQPVRVD